jgi:hypothetical protein
MATGDMLLGIKQKLSPLLLRIPGVSGVGTPGGRLTVYLAEDAEPLRRQVAAVVDREVPGTPISYVVTGTFRPH